MNKIQTFLAYTSIVSASLLPSGCCTIVGMVEGAGAFAYSTGKGMYEDGKNTYQYISQKLKSSGSNQSDSPEGSSKLEDLTDPSE